jgi:sugar phosphate isomerase/epimerase
MTFMIRIAAFPKCYMKELCITRSISIFEWIEMASKLGLDGLELNPAFFTSFDRGYVSEVRDVLRRHNLIMPMLCATPDFTQADPEMRRAEVQRYKTYIDLVAFFDAPAPRTSRVLSGQRRDEISEDDGVAMTIECIEALLPYAADHGVTLALENHYKASFWVQPEFAQKLRVFRRILDAIPSPWLGVNYDPSNAILAGDDPLTVLDIVKDRVVSMHASDRGLVPGHTLEELQALDREDTVGYADILHHGQIGTGLNDFPTIFRVLRAVGFTGWVSIEDGMNGLDEIKHSAEFLRATLGALDAAT